MNIYMCLQTYTYSVVTCLDFHCWCKS